MLLELDPLCRAAVQRLLCSHLCQLLRGDQDCPPVACWLGMFVAHACVKVAQQKRTMRSQTMTLLSRLGIRA